MKLIDRTLAVLLELAGSSKGLTMTELSEKLGISTSAMHRILSSLKDNHFVAQSMDSKIYRLGYRVLSLASNISIEDNFSLAAEPFVQELYQEVEATVGISVLEGQNIICLSCVGHNPSLMVNPGVAMPAYVTSAGKAILAFSRRDVVQRVFEESSKIPMTTHGIQKLEGFISELEKVRKDGVAYSTQEVQLQAQGIACPIFDFASRPIAAVSITADLASKKITQENISLLKTCAKKITANIGGRTENYTYRG